MSVFPAVGCGSSGRGPSAESISRERGSYEFHQDGGTLRQFRPRPPSVV